MRTGGLIYEGPNNSRECPVPLRAPVMELCGGQLELPAGGNPGAGKAPHGVSP